MYNLHDICHDTKYHSFSAAAIQFISITAGAYSLYQRISFLEYINRRISRALSSDVEESFCAEKDAAITGRAIIHRIRIATAVNSLTNRVLRSPRDRCICYCRRHCVVDRRLPSSQGETIIDVFMPRTAGTRTADVLHFGSRFVHYCSTYVVSRALLLLLHKEVGREDKKKKKENVPYLPEVDMYSAVKAFVASQ